MALSHSFIPPNHLPRQNWRHNDGYLFLPAVAAEIARTGGTCHRSSSRIPWRQAGSLADGASVADERVRGWLIKRRRPRDAIALLESHKRLLRLRAQQAIERAIVEAREVKLCLRPPDVVF
jgi:hypothetical protein